MGSDPPRLSQDVEKGTESEVNHSQNGSASSTARREEEVLEASAEKPDDPISGTSSDTVAATPLDWTSPTDPENPYNWSLPKKTYHIAVPTMLSMVVIMGSSIYMPAYLEIAKTFHVSSTAAILPFTTYILGLVFGPMLSAPISETKGRHLVYVVTIPIYALFVLGSGFAPNFGALVVLRFFAGLFGSPPLAVAAGTVADLYEKEKRGSPVAGISMTGFFGSAVGIIIGSYVANRKNWQWTQWTLLFFIVATYISVLFTSETYKKTILQKRAQRLGIKLPQSGPKGAAALKFILMITLTRPLHMLSTEPIVIFLSIYTACNFATVYSFFVAFPFVFSTEYHFSASQDGLPFIAIAVGSILGCAISVITDKLLYQPRAREAAKPGATTSVQPEMRLYGAMMGCVFPPIGLFWFAWTAKSSVHWASPVVAAVPIAAGYVAVFVAVVLYLVDAYEALLGASAMGANGILRYVLGAVFPLFTFQMYKNLGIGWATSLLGFISLAMVPIPWVIWKWGRAIRRRSKYGHVGM